MKRIIIATAAVGIGATASFAGGVERTNQSVGLLFEEGRYLEFGITAGSPDVSGALGPSNSGDMTESFTNLSFSYKADINERLSYALILNQPYGADVSYPLVAYPFAGSTALLESNAITGILKYTNENNFSVYGGLRAQSLSAEAVINLPIFDPGTGALLGIANYAGTLDRDIEFGYLVGAAYERPDIALRVSLTYGSEIEYSLATEETGLPPGDSTSTTEVTTPQSLHLEFQTGIAEDTLLFGGIRWVDWTEFEIAPELYTNAIGSPLVSFRDDRTTFTLGLGRRLSDQWSIAGSVSYEETTGSRTGNLGPTDGFLAGTLAAVYTQNNTKVTAGVSYVDIGNALTTANASFTGNSAVGFGLKVGYSF